MLTLAYIVAMTLPPRETMLQAMQTNDPEFDGLFFTAVKSTGIFSIMVPCHRVVGSDGKLTGYGGGLWHKKYLLSVEQSQSFSLS